MRPKSSDVPVSQFDPHDPGLASRQHEVLADLVDRCPVSWSDRHGGFWAIARFEDVVASARDYHTFSAEQGIMVPATGATTPIPPVEVDPPDHAKYRKILLPHFIPKAVAGYEGLIREAVTSLVDAFRADGRAELVEAIAKPLPTLVLAGVLGLDPAEGQETLELIDEYLLALNGGPARRQAAAHALESFMERQIDRRRGNPDRDVLAQIIDSTVDGEPIDPAMLLGMIHVLISAGHETTINGIANLLYYVATIPGLRDRLLADRTLIPAVVAETLRIDSPVMCMARTVVAPTHLGEVELEVGDKALLLYGAANRDPERFPDPAEFQLDREASHIAFGSGPHRCLGEHLALLELQTVLDHILDVLPDYHVPDDARIVWGSGAVRRGVRQLPVAFTPVR